MSLNEIRIYSSSSDKGSSCEIWGVLLDAGALPRVSLFGRTCLVSHMHGDHVRKAKEFEFRGCRVLYPGKDFGHKSVMKVGDVLVKAVLLMHDIDCYGFLLRKGSEYALYAVDTYDIPYRFPKLRWLLLGIDYDEYTLWNSALNHELPLSLAERISNSHMSLERARRFLARQEYENLVIMHYGQWLNLELAREIGGSLWTEIK